MSDQSPRLNWVTVGALAVFHVGAVAALFLFAWQALWIALALLWVSGGWGIGMGYHRLLTHRGYPPARALTSALFISRDSGQNFTPVPPVAFSTNSLCPTFDLSCLRRSLLLASRRRQNNGHRRTLLLSWVTTEPPNLPSPRIALGWALFGEIHPLR
jgi:hypothetical protein